MAEGILSDAAIRTFVDGLASVFKVAAPTLGLAQSTESGTASKKAQDAFEAMSGIGNPDFQAKAEARLKSLRNRLMWDKLFSAGDIVQAMSDLDNNISQGLPSGWKITDSTILHAFDAWLLRINGTQGPSTGTPAAGSTAAANNSNGNLPVTNSNAPWIVHACVGDSDRKESPASTPVQGATIGNAHNSYTYTVATPGTPPAGTSKVRLYRTKYGGSSSGPFYWEEDFTVTSGWPTMKILKPDSLLRTDITPAQWCQTLIPYEFALLWALSYSSYDEAKSLLRMFQSSHLLSPENIFLVPATQLLHGNILQHGLYGTYVIGTAWTASGIRTAHDAANNALGFAGGLGNGTSGIQARVTSALNVGGTVAISYGYYALANGWGSLQTDTLTSDAFSGTAVGSTANFDIPAGRIVRTVTVTGVTGPASGTFVVEGQQARTY